MAEQNQHNQVSETRTDFYLKKKSLFMKNMKMKQLFRI